jgi:hypothetical protein
MPQELSVAFSAALGFLSLVVSAATLYVVII